MFSIKIKSIRDISNHSCRAGVPTMCQEHDIHIPEEILMNLGRWQTSVHQQYRKSFGAALQARRFIEEEIVARIGKKKPRTQDFQTVSKDYLPPPKKTKFSKFK